jgi:hypothetical protein
MLGHFTGVDGPNIIICSGYHHRASYQNQKKKKKKKKKKKSFFLFLKLLSFSIIYYDIVNEII